MEKKSTHRLSTLSRRHFIAGGLALTGSAAGAASAASSRPPAAGKRFYKGQFHVHTWWSDGRAAPEQAVAYYKERGYDFLALTDHNVYAAGRRVKRLKQTNADEMAVLDAYRRDFPGAVVDQKRKGEFDVELATLARLRERFEQPGRFILLDGVEGTTNVRNAAGVAHAVHMNYLNVPAVPDYFRRCGTAATVAERISLARRAVADAARKLGRREMFILNHPLWKWYDVQPEDLIANAEVRFFEVCNSGSPFAPGKGLPSDGLDADRFWDVVNAFRARNGQPLLYGVGTDDTHYFFGTKNTVPADGCVPLNAWCRVRAASLTADALISAMADGDFAACEGLEPDDFSFDAASGTLTVSVAGQRDVCRTIEFIVSKKDFCAEPVKTLTIFPLDETGKRRARACRTVNVYGNGIGQVVKSVTGRMGEPVRSSYRLAPDDLYVRARILSPEHPRIRPFLHPKCRMAWTQPYTPART
jgi:hypothetical protein